MAKRERLDSPILEIVSASRILAVSVNRPTIQGEVYLVSQLPHHHPHSEPASPHSRGLAQAEEVFSVPQSQPRPISSERLRLPSLVAVSSALQEALAVDLEVGQLCLVTTTSKTTNSRSHSLLAILRLPREHSGQVTTHLAQTTPPATPGVGFLAARTLRLLVSRSSSQLRQILSAALVNRIKTNLRQTTLLLVALVSRNSKNRSQAGCLVARPILILEGDCLALSARTTTNSSPRQEEDYLEIQPTTNRLEARCLHLSLLTLVEASLVTRPQTILILEAVYLEDSETITMRINSRIRLVECSETPPTSSRSLEVYLATLPRTQVADCLAAWAPATTITTSRQGIIFSEETISNSNNRGVFSVIPTIRVRAFLDHSNNNSSPSSNKTPLHPHQPSMPP